MAELSPKAQPGDFHLGFAGDTFNTAWYLAMLSPDIDVSYFTAVGDEALSERMLRAMSEAGIGTRHIRKVKGRALGLYMISLDKGERSFSYWREQSAARLLAEDTEALNAAIAESDLVYVSGITLAILDGPGRNTLLEAMRSARRAGKRVAFDPNLRLHLWDGAGQMTEVIMQAAACCNIALPSFEDEARWFADKDAEATLDRYVGAGADTVIVKNGAASVHYRQNGRNGAVPVQALASVVDTTAAGDSFNAAVLAGLATDMPLGEAIEQGCRLAGQVVQSRGALVPIRLNLLEQFA